MFDLNKYLQDLISECKSAFGCRLLYVGLQGSYMRGEATDRSDIDIMIILDDFSVADMDVYREILKKIGHYEKSCGFICGKRNVFCLPRQKAFSFRFRDTKTVENKKSSILYRLTAEKFTQ